MTQLVELQKILVPLRAAGFEPFAISNDTVERLRDFADRYAIDFPLLSDEDKAMSTAYEAWGEKKQYGRTFMGMIRKTYLIDEKGKIRKIWPKVKVASHVDEVLAAVKGD